MKIFAPISPIVKAYNAGLTPSLSDGASPLHTWIYWPDSCWLLSNRPLFVPDFAPEFVAIPAVAAKIGRLGKSIALRFASRYISEFTAAFIILPVRAISEFEKGKIPTPADICFDNAIVMGDWHKIEPENLDKNLNFQLSVKNSGNEVSSSSLEANFKGIFSLISEVSKTNILKMGDVILFPAFSDAESASSPGSAFPISEGVSAKITLLSPSLPDTPDIIPAPPLLSTNFK